MSSASPVAATLRPDTRQQIAIEALAKTKSISPIAVKHQVSHKLGTVKNQPHGLVLQNDTEVVRIRNY